MSRNLALQLAAILAMATNATAISRTTRFVQMGNTSAHGDVLSVVRVGSNVQCGSTCSRPSCVGYFLEVMEDGLLCTAFSSVANLTDHNGTNFYCADCYGKGERCSSDDQCTTLTECSRCDPDSLTCQCQSWCQDEGLKCVPRPVAIGGACQLDEQCLALVENAHCSGGVCACAPDFIQEGLLCRFDYAAHGFTPYEGRVVKHRASADGLLSWNGAVDYCAGLHAALFRPRTASEWDWLVAEGKSSVLAVGIYFPVNDKDTEGEVLWNDGSSAAGASVIKWEFPEGGNTAITDCTALTWTLVTPAKASFILCGLAHAFAVVCEASGQGL
ncbi:uncharacterized protein [Penaeus vannamei]|uniref:uncharacterized protein n=1 Tax=Penaeus vannamei TaxID=6689 RepID=UPI00387F7D81